jgi:hypothetical protein
MEDKDFIGKLYPQNCGDNLRVIEKTENKDYKGNYLYKCKFQKYPFEGLFFKQNILNGRVNNPQIEQVEFIEKIWPQNCGDSLKILRKTEEKSKDGKFLFECIFIKYPHKCFITKNQILAKTVLNPQIEQVEFIDKIWPQNCGDNLKIIRKINNGNWECEFIKYPCKVLAQKNNIKLGIVSNPQIEQVEFIGKEFPQNCGDILKVIRKTDKKYNGEFLFECHFIKYFSKIFALKKNIKEKNVINPNLPYKNKILLEKYIKYYFPNNKPSLEDLSKVLEIAPSTISHKINEFNLRNYISYSYKGLEKEIKDYLCTLELNEIKSSYWDKELKKEIDIFVPNFNLGIEVNGNLWHSNHLKFGVSNTYHQEKSLEFKEKNINILHIFEYEWKNNEDIIKSLIKSKLGIFEKKIFARKCEIKELYYQEYADFCNKNHLQGECGAKVKLGLFYQEELVQIMSFSLPRFTDKYEWEIIRECSKLGYIIIGGKEKLWKHFLKK